MKPMRGAENGIDGRVRLKDGRWLGYRQYGTVQGTPVLYFHGGLSARTDIAFAEPTLKTMNIRLIAPDRPGIGISDRRAKFSVIDWADDVEQLMDQLSLSSACVLGWSCGGPYALACAHRLKHRLTAAATAGCPEPLNQDSLIDQLGLWADRVLFRVSDKAPYMGSTLLIAASMLPRSMLKHLLLRDLRSDSDRSIVSAMDLQAVTGSFLEGLRNGTEGTIDDYRAVAEPWGFSLEDVSMPVDLWHGLDDAVCPVKFAHYLAGKIPNAQLHTLAGAGHFLLNTHLKEIMNGLLT